MWASSDCNASGSIMRTNGHNTAIRIFNSRFIQNVGLLLFGVQSNMLIIHTEFISNSYSGFLAMVYVNDSDLTISDCTFTKNKGYIVKARQTNFNMSSSTGSTSQVGDTSLSITNSKFAFNKGALVTSSGNIVSIDHGTITDNFISWILDTSDTTMASITHNKFVGNTVTNSLALPDAATEQESMVSLDTLSDNIIVILNEFIANIAGSALVHIRYYSAVRTVTSNAFTDNSAEYEIYIAPFCRADLRLSLGSSRCIQCSENWHQDLIGIAVGGFIAGIVLVILMLAFNMTVAISTLNGILFSSLGSGF